jgi:hypothetical protein
MDLREMGWTGFDWLRIGPGGELLCVRWWTFGFRKENRILFDNEWQSVFQRISCTVEL